MEEVETMCSKLSSESNITWELIPEHIIWVIFSKLSIVNLPTCRLICKAWNYLVLDYASHSKFVPNTFFVLRSYIIDDSLTSLLLKPKDMLSGYHRMHCIDFDGKYSQGMNVVASFRFDPSYLDIIRISNSCNGLLCVIDGMNDDSRTRASILNPMTNEYIKLPAGYEEASKDLYYYYGFGFSLKTMQYKVVRVSCHVEERADSIYFDAGSITEIFTLGKSSKWNHVAFLPFSVNCDGIYFNGALYWIGLDDYLHEFVCCFDVEEENFEIISLPKVDSSMNFCLIGKGIGVFNDRLCIAYWDEELKFEVWTMQSYERGKNSWTKEFVLDDYLSNHGELKRIHRPPCWGHLQLIKACENGEILFLFDRLYLFSYNPKTGKTKALIKDEEDERRFWIYPMESLNFDSLEKIMLGG